MAKIRLLFITISFVVIINSCDCSIKVTGVILDKETGLPIDSVAIGRTDTIDLDNPFNDKAYSDSTGKYNYHRISGSCNTVILYFIKKGYKTLKIETKINKNDTIKMTPEGTRLPSARPIR